MVKLYFQKYSTSMIMFKIILVFYIYIYIKNKKKIFQSYCLTNHIFMHLLTLTQKFLFKSLSSTLFLTVSIFPVDFTHLFPHLIYLLPISQCLQIFLCSQVSPIFLLLYTHGQSSYILRIFLLISYYFHSFFGCCLFKNVFMNAYINMTLFLLA